MAGRASIVGAAETSVGKVREHNEDSHFIDPDAGIFVVCDGMGGHAAGEVASALAVQTVRHAWASEQTKTVAEQWLAVGTPAARKQLIHTVQAGVIAAHDAIVSEAAADRGKQGMGTTLVGAIVVGGDIVFAHAGDSRAYLVREGIAMQLTEDHTLLARLLAAGVDVDVDGEGMRFKSMLTNALGIGHECKVSTFVVPVADGDRFLLCSDGITEYVQEAEIGEVLSTMPSPARSAQRLVELALQRGGGDNATALVVRVLEAGETARPSELLRREEQAIYACPLWHKVNPQQRLRALRIALPRDYVAGEKIPAQTLGDRVAWIVIEGELEQDGHLRGPGSLLYPEALLGDRPLPDKDGLAVAQSEFRGLALRADDFREICDEDPELGEVLLSALASEIALRRPHRRTGKIVVQVDGEPRGPTDPGEDIGRMDTGQRQAIANDDTGELPALPRASTDKREELGRLDTGQLPAVSVSRSNTAEREAIGRSDTAEIAAQPSSPSLPLPPPSLPARQPKSSTVPPHLARPRSNTDKGTPVAAVVPPELVGVTSGEIPDRREEPTMPERPSAPRLHPRGSTPPTGSGLIVPLTERADAEADLDRALMEISAEHQAPEIVDDDEPEITVEPATPPPPARVLAARIPAPAPAPKPRRPAPSEPEIHIERLEAAAAEEPEEVVMMVEDDSARVVEILKDTSSQTITLTVDPSEPEIIVEKLAAAPAGRAKRQTDAPD